MGRKGGGEGAACDDTARQRRLKGLSEGNPDRKPDGKPPSLPPATAGNTLGFSFTGLEGRPGLPTEVDWVGAQGAPYGCSMDSYSLDKAGTNGMAPRGGIHVKQRDINGETKSHPGGPL